MNSNNPAIKELLALNPNQANLQQPKKQANKKEKEVEIQQIQRVFMAS